MARSRFNELYQVDPAVWERERTHNPLRDVFEVQLDRRMDRDCFVLRMWSRMYDVELGYELAHTYRARVDPRRVVDRAHQIIGTTLRAWHEARIEPGIGREMARALIPHWQQLIQREMERFEYEDRRYARELRDVVYHGTNAPWLWEGPREDPKAKEKARQLLMRNLDEGQLKSFKKEGWFNVTGADGVRYKISTARSFNVEAADGTAYCGQLTDTPVEDQMLAQKLMLQENPQEFIRQSNKRPPLPDITVDRQILAYAYGSARYGA